MSISSELPVVSALRSLSVFGVSQEGAYREHFKDISTTLGPDVSSKLGRWVSAWAQSREPGIVILTGNAGTGKTAVAQSYCSPGELPSRDDLLPISADRWLIKDLSGIPTTPARMQVLTKALQIARKSQVLVCANEGVLRRSLQNDGAVPHFAPVIEVLNQALRQGAAKRGNCTIVNVNRQRPTAEGFWNELLDFLTRPELWTQCQDCPQSSTGCPMQTNSESLRRKDVRAALRFLFRYASGITIPTLREVLSLVAWSIIGDRMDQSGLTCQKVKDRSRDFGRKRLRCQVCLLLSLIRKRAEFRNGGAISSAKCDSVNRARRDFRSRDR